MNRKEQETGPSGPVFFLLLFALVASPACTPRATQPPTIDLARVHPSGAHRIAFDPAGRRLASGGLHGYVRIWSLARGSELMSYRVHHARITGLAWLDTTHLISADHAGWLKITAADSARTKKAIKLDRIDKLRLSPDRKWLVVTNPMGLYRLSLPGLQTAAQRDLPVPPLALAIDPAGDRIAVATADRTVHLLNTALETRRELPRASRKAQDLAFSPDGDTLLGGGWFRLLAWDLRHNQLEEYSTEHLGKINSVAISPDGAHWLSLGRETDSHFLMTNAITHQVERRFEVLPLCGQQARFSPDGRFAAASSDDGSIHIYDLNQPYRPVVRYMEFDD